MKKQLIYMLVLCLMLSSFSHVGVYASDTLERELLGDYDQTNNFGIANDFHVFTIEDYITTGDSVEGRVAVGGTYENPNPTLGNAATIKNGVGTLIVKGAVDIRSGSIFNPNKDRQVIVDSKTKIKNFVNYMGKTVTQTGIIDFEAAKTHLQGLSNTLWNMRSNGEVYAQYGSILYLKGTNKEENVFHINGDAIINYNYKEIDPSRSTIQLKDVNTIYLEVPETSRAIINIRGDNLRLSGGVNVPSSIPANKIIWNFSKDSQSNPQLTIGSIAVRGTILAPFHQVTLERGTIYGQLIAYRAMGSITMKKDYFNGNLPEPEIESPKRAIRILEVQPTNSYVLSESKLQNNGFSEVELVQMPMSQFIGSIEDLSGSYDVIFMGSKSKNYVHWGNKAIMPSGNALTNITSQNEYDRDNDITKKMLDKIYAYEKNGQLLVLDQGLTSAASNSYMNTLYDKYKNTRQNNIYLANTSDTNFFKLLNTYYLQSNKRPQLVLKEEPIAYTSQHPRYLTDGVLRFTFDAYSHDLSPMKVNLYLDINGDGIYSESEKIEAYNTPIKTNQRYSYSYALPDNYVGLMPWKLELVNSRTGTKDYKIGYTALRGSKQQVIKVLQISPDGNTLDIGAMVNYMQNNKETKHLISDYDIQIENIHVKDLQKRYIDNKDYTINGKYNMLILGFADIYGGNDITNNLALEDILRYINTGQSVMFTHDTLSYMHNTWDQGRDGWGSKLTKNFRALIGQDRYHTIEKYPNNQFSYGFTQMALERDRRTNPIDFERSNQTFRLNEGLITQYPFTLGNIEVQTTHYQYYQLDLEDEEVVPWFTLDGNRNDKLDPRHYYYTYSKGNITFSGTGHSDLSSMTSYIEEKKLFINTIIKASRGANHAPLIHLQDVELVETENGQKENVIRIPKTNLESKIKFYITDLDIGDKQFGGKLYIDRNHNGQFDEDEAIRSYHQYDHTALQERREYTELVELTEDMFSAEGTSNVAMLRLEVWDGQGALSYEDIKVIKVDTPIIKLSNSPKGALIGDSVRFTTEVQFETANVNEKRIGDIVFQGKLTATENSQPIGLNEIMQVSDWKGVYNNQKEGFTKGLEDIYIVQGVPSRAKDRIEIEGIAKKEGVYQYQSGLNFSFEQLNIKGSSTATTEFGIKEGVISVLVVNEYGQGIQNASVKLMKGANHEIQTRQGMTPTSGSINFGLLTTAQYQVVVEKDGIIKYSPVVNLNYDTPNSERLITLVLESAQATIDISGKDYRNRAVHELYLSKHVREQELLIDIRVTKPVNYFEFILDSTQFDYSIEGTSDFAIDNNRIYLKDGRTLTDSVNLKLIAKPKKIISDGSQYEIKALDIKLRELGNSNVVPGNNQGTGLMIIGDSLAPKIVITDNKFPVNIVDTHSSVTEVYVAVDNLEAHYKFFVNNNSTYLQEALNRLNNLDNRLRTPVRELHYDHVINKGVSYVVIAVDKAGNIAVEVIKEKNPILIPLT